MVATVNLIHLGDASHLQVRLCISTHVVCIALFNRSGYLLKATIPVAQHFVQYQMYLIGFNLKGLFFNFIMNTYSVHSTLQFDGESLGTVQASNIDEALERAKTLYGADVTVIQQYTTSTIGFDPMWILLALLLAGMYFRKKRS